MRNEYVLIILVLLAAFTYDRWKSQQEEFLPGRIAPSEPLQRSTEQSNSFPFQKYTIQPLASFELKAVVLSTQSYFWGDDAKLSPVDLALGWGPMSDGDVLDDINISQGNRWYFFNYKIPPIPRDDIVSHSANMHLIPATDEIRKAIKKTQKGDVVELKGYLVNVSKPDGWRWNSSLSRTDSGQGSCELVWVDNFKVLDI